jgi:hypothetical protein
MLRASADPLSAEEREEGKNRYLGREEEHRGSVRDSVERALKEHKDDHPPDFHPERVRDKAARRNLELKKLHEEDRIDPYLNDKHPNPDRREGKSVRQALELAFEDNRLQQAGWTDETLNHVNRAQRESAEIRRSADYQVIGPLIHSMEDAAKRGALTKEMRAFIKWDAATGTYSPKAAAREIRKMLKILPPH